MTHASTFHRTRAGDGRTDGVRRAQRFVLFEAATFAAAASLHGGLLGDAAHAPAATAEAVIAAVLVAALALGRMPDPWPVRCAAGAQAFALAGVFVGLVAIATGAGPQSVPDVAYHVAMVPLLIAGIASSVPHQVERPTEGERR